MRWSLNGWGIGMAFTSEARKRDDRIAEDRSGRETICALLEEGEYERLCREAGAAADVEAGDLPPFPKADARGRFPALEYARVSLASDPNRARRGRG